ncbi:MAG TPA: DUF1835 domain-containing protein [Chitinophagaceae bacterium]|nr:DUF1835 domain-containing protein [Chitinophagaceae bacterium]HQX71457.1 DUF1835 domain-containing protein [Chitinophagaceae bacterium]
MIHIVFNESEVELMKQVIELDETMSGDVIQIRDDYAVGPLSALDTEEGRQSRLNWWKDLLSYSHYQESQVHHFDDRETVQLLKSKLDENPDEELWIWMGQNQHDVCGYYWLMPQLKDYQGRVMVLFLNNLPFINEKGHIFYPSWLNEIQPKEFIKAKKLARPITLSEFEVDPDEWVRIVNDGGLVRILEGGKKIASKDDTFYDKEVLKNLTPEWQKAWRLVSNTLHRMPVKTGDVFIEWRIRQLIEQGKIEVTGDVSKGWKDFDVKLPGTKQQETELTEEALQ